MREMERWEEKETGKQKEDRASIVCQTVHAWLSSNYYNK
jgi:hypothetical protein